MIFLEALIHMQVTVKVKIKREKITSFRLSKLQFIKENLLGTKFSILHSLLLSTRRPHISFHSQVES